jgi:hypothetical protein
MALNLLGDPFAAEANTALDEGTIREASPSMPDTKVQDLIRAVENESWSKQEGVNEKFMLDKELSSIGSYVSAELGPFALDTYEMAQPLVSAGVLRIINEGDRTGSFRGENARGGSQWDISQLTVDALNPPETDPSQYRVYDTVQGDFNIAPALDGSGTEDRDPANDSSSNIGSEDDGTHKLDEDTQAVFVLGFYSSTNPRVVEQAKAGVDDGESRTAFDVYSHQNVGTLQVQETPSLEYITDDDTFDINGTATEAATTDIYPFGVNINTAQQLPDLDTKV